MRHSGLLILLLYCLPHCTAAAREPDAASLTPAYQLDALAMSLADAPDTLRADLAYIAIDELAAAYASEADRARNEAGNQPGKRDLRRWANAVEDLALELSALAETVSGATPVQLGISPESSIYLIVDGKPVVVNGPRPREQAALEQRVVRRFCKLNPCDQLIDTDLVSQSSPAAPITAPHWSFSEEKGPICGTVDGLAFQFRSIENLRQKRQTCARVVAELYLLTTEIARHKAGGTHVEWNGLVIHGVPGEAQQLVQLNSDGDTLQLPLPSLAGKADLIELLLPWLAAKVNGVDHHLEVSDAERLLE
jgi:hypothetical protein